MPKLMAAARRAGLDPIGGARPTDEEVDRAFALTHDPEPRVRRRP